MQSQLQKIYEELHPFYQLLYIYDVEPYSLNDLKSLALRLQAQLNLDERQKNIHERLIQKSKDNVEKKIREKKKKANVSSQVKQESKVQNKPQGRVQQIKQAGSKQQRKEDEACYIDESCILDQPLGKDTFGDVRTIEGQIYDGKLMVSLPTNSKILQKNIYYELCPQVNECFLTKETSKQFSQKANQSSMVLAIYGKPVDFRVVDSQSNTLGMNYLRSNNILIKCNYRTECLKFSMIFTQ